MRCYGLRHLDADRPAAEHEQPARHLGEPGHLPVRPDALELAQAGDGREHGVRPGRDHDMARAIGLVVHLDAPRAGQTPRPAKHLDPLPFEVGGLGPVLVVRHHEVAPLEGARGSDAPVHGFARSRCLARRLERLARPQQRLRRDAGPVVALAPDELAFDDRHPQAGVRETPRTMLPRRTGTDDDDVELAGAAHRDLSSGGPGVSVYRKSAQVELPRALTRLAVERNPDGLVAVRAAWAASPSKRQDSMLFAPESGVKRGSRRVTYDARVLAVLQRTMGARRPAVSLSPCSSSPSCSAPERLSRGWFSRNVRRVGAAGAVRLRAARRAPLASLGKPCSLMCTSPPWTVRPSGSTPSRSAPPSCAATSSS
jgi:hypothetical protein